jgi:hypothetical protein
MTRPPSTNDQCGPSDETTLSEMKKKDPRADEMIVVIWMVIIFMALLLFTMTIILFAVLLSGLPLYIKSFTMVSFVTGIYIMCH